MTKVQDDPFTNATLPPDEHSSAFPSLQAPKPHPRELNSPSHSLIVEFHRITAQTVKTQLLTILPLKPHPLSVAANDLVALCVYRTLVGRWYFNGWIRTVDDVKEYILCGWRWSQLWKTRFRKSFSDIVINREKLLANGMSLAASKVAKLRQLVWPSLEEPLVEDRTVPFIEEHWPSESLVAKLSEDAV